LELAREELKNKRKEMSLESLQQHWCFGLLKTGYRKRREDLAIPTKFY
jgi:hypothetical protein